jgi:hypothetical protein
VIVRNCVGAATTPICSRQTVFWPEKHMVLGYAFVSAFCGPVQGSLKSDRLHNPPADRKRSNQKKQSEDMQLGDTGCPQTN